MSEVSIITRMTNTYNLNKSSDILTYEMVQDFLCKMKDYTKDELRIVQHIALDMKKRKAMGVSLLSLAHYYARAIEKVYNNSASHKQLVKICYYEIKNKM